jgi:hypothetical protein
MEYRGHVEAGRVLLDDPAALPDGTVVSVRPLKATRKTGPRRRRRPTLAERLAPFIGKARGLPADAATNLDYYLYGLPKRK